MKKIKLLGLIILSCFSFTTFAQKAKTVKLYVNSFEIPCENNTNEQCLQIRKSLNDQWQSISKSAIEGFNFESGFDYRIKTLQNENADNYQLKKVILKKRVPFNELNGQTLILTKINNEEVPFGVVSAKFDTQNQTLSGTSGCNFFNLSYTTTKKGVLNAYSAMGTLMACDEAKMKLESKFLDAIQNQSFKIETLNDLVVFSNTKNKASIEFKITSTNDVLNSLANKEFKLINLNNVGKDFKGAFIKFDTTDKRFYGNTGCNNFFGSFDINGKKMLFSQIGLTSKFCVDQDVNENENIITNYLYSGELNFEITNTTINFYKDNRLVMVFEL